MVVNIDSVRSDYHFNYICEQLIKNNERFSSNKILRQININGYSIKFKSKYQLKDINKVRRIRPEIVCLCCNCNEIKESIIYLKSAVSYSTRKEPIRNIFTYYGGNDIFTDNFDFNKFINTKSKTYKENRNKWIKNKLQYIITFGGKI